MGSTAASCNSLEAPRSKETPGLRPGGSSVVDSSIRTDGNRGGFEMRLRSIFVSVATVGLMVGPALVHGAMGSVAGAAKDCTISGTAADDELVGTTKADVICTKAGSDQAGGLEGNDVIRGGQGDDNSGQYGGLCGGDGSDTVKGQQDDDNVEGAGQNDKLY